MTPREFRRGIVFYRTADVRDLELAEKGNSSRKSGWLGKDSAADRNVAEV